jgi:hypothetical protein
VAVNTPNCPEGPVGCGGSSIGGGSGFGGIGGIGGSTAGLRGSANPVTQNAARIGQEAHRQIQRDLSNQGYEPEVTINLPGGGFIRKDAVKGSEAVIIKPDTPTGRRAAEERAGLVKDLGRDPRVILYDPTDPRFLPGSPTYIGPKVK